MSVWKRFQRVGKKAGKFQFTASYTELLIETNSFKPSNVVITWMRRNRKYPSAPIKLIEIKSKFSSYCHVWEVPRNEEMVTTLYKMKKELDYEEKDWTFQIEDVGDHGTRRRLLAYRNINMAQYAEVMPTHNDIKINFKIASKKIKSATLFLTLTGVFLREGDATDDDMISVASLMSLPSSQNFALMHNSDIARLSDFDDMSSDQSSGINEKFSEIFDKIGNLDCQNWNIDGEENNSNTTTIPIKESDEYPIKELSLARTSPLPVLRPSVTNRDAEDNDRLSNIAEEDHSPSVESNSTSDLLDWCKFITCGYKNVSITNFTTSFRNGVAFCAIIHHFHPELIDFDSLTPSSVKENNRIAFSVAASLGIPKVLDPNEMNFLKVPDSLSIMTYLHQLRTHFTDSNLVVTAASIGNNSQHGYSKQVVSNMTSTPIESKEFDHFVPKSIHNSISEENGGSNSAKNGSTSSRPHVTDDTKTISALPSNSETLGSKIHNVHIPKNETTNPVTLKKSDTESSVKLKSPNKSKLKLSSLNVDGSIKEDSSWSEKKIKRVNPGKLNLLSTIDSSETVTKQTTTTSPVKKPSVSSPGSIKKVSLTVDSDPTENSYICAETAALEREQEKIDDEASQLERQLRLVMNKDKVKESFLLGKWFVLVNKKNALIRRNMQLQMLDKEQDLEKKCSLLQEELRQINAIEDWNKSDDIRRREDLLMKDLISMINQRDKVVRDLDDYEQRIATDIEYANLKQDMYVAGNSNKIARSIANVKLTDKNCVIQ